MNNAAASHVSMEYNLKGPSFIVSTACASSNHAMAQAFQMVRSGLSDARAGPRAVRRAHTAIDQSVQAVRQLLHKV